MIQHGKFLKYGLRVGQGLDFSYPRSHLNRMDMICSQKVKDLPDLRGKLRVFKGRQEAGKVLAHMLVEAKAPIDLILAVPAGGVPVAKGIALSLDRPWDLAVVKKITPPENTEWGYGAVAWDGSRLLNEDYLNRVEINRGTLKEDVLKADEKVKQRLKKFRGGLPFPEIKGKTILLVDDGLATGITLRTAVLALHNLGAKKIIIAVPTAHRESIQGILHEVDGFFCPNIRAGFPFAVADAYEVWYDIPDQELEDYLKYTKNL